MQLGQIGLQGPNGPGPELARAQMGPGPNGPWPKQRPCRGQMGPGPHGPWPKWPTGPNVRGPTNGPQNEPGPVHMPQAYTCPGQHSKGRARPAIIYNIACQSIWHGPSLPAQHKFFVKVLCI